MRDYPAWLARFIQRKAQSLGTPSAAEDIDRRCRLAVYEDIADFIAKLSGRSIPVSLGVAVLLCAESDEQLLATVSSQVDLEDPQLRAFQADVARSIAAIKVAYTCLGERARSLLEDALGDEIWEVELEIIYQRADAKLVASQVKRRVTGDRVLSQARVARIERKAYRTDFRLFPQET